MDLQQGHCAHQLQDFLGLGASLCLDAAGREGIVVLEDAAVAPVQEHSDRYSLAVSVEDIADRSVAVSAYSSMPSGQED